MAVVESDFDIYGDLDDALQPLSSEKKEILIPEPKPEEDKVSEVLIALEKENEKLKNENILLTKNVSILLLTAKAEIERKDNQIKELRKEKDEIVFRKHKKNIHTAEKWSQTSIYSTRDSGSQTLGDKIDNQRSNRDFRDYNKNSRSNECRSSRDGKSRRSRSRDRRKRSRSSSRSNRHDFAIYNEKRPRTNYPSSTESRYSQSKSNSTDDIIREEKPKVLGAYEDISPIKRQSGDASMHLYPAVPIELNVKSSKIAKTTGPLVNGNHLKEAMPLKLNFDFTEVIVQPTNTAKLKDCRIAEKVPKDPIDKLKLHMTTKEAITTEVVPSTPLSSLKTEIKQEPNAINSPLLIPRQETAVIPKLDLVTPVKIPLNVVKSPVVKSPSIVKSTAVVIKSEPLSPKHAVSIQKSPRTLSSALKENGITSSEVPTEVFKETEQTEDKLMKSPEVAEKVKIKIESISPTVWENSNSTYRKEIVDGAEVIKIVRKPRIKKRKVVVN